MDGPTKRKRWFRFQLRLATLFWIMFSTACFFAGRNWEEISNSVFTALGKNGTQIRLAAGKSTIITSKTQVPRALVSNQAVCRVVPLSPNQIQVVAVAKGVSTLNLWDAAGNVTTYDVTVPR